MSSKFYSIYVLSGKENKVRDSIINRATKLGYYGDSIQEILIPTEKIYVTKQGKRQIVDKKVFPGYLFVKMHLDKYAVDLINKTDGVTGFVRSGQNPVPLDETEMNKILSNIDNQKETPKSAYKVNDLAQIVSGPFSDFTAKIEHIDEEKGKVKCYVQIFGRDTLTEFKMEEIELVKQ